MKTTSIALIGAGYIAGEHARALKQIPEAKLVTVFDAARDRAEKLAASYKMKVVDSYKQAVESADMVWICSPPLLHEKQITEALKAGHNVFCEKPLALSMKAMKAMAAAEKKSGKHVAIGHSNRYYPAYRKARDIFASGELGKFVSVWSQRMGHYPREQIPPWRLSVAQCGGMTVEVGVHELDFIHWVGGEVESVFAQQACAVLNPPDYDDSLSAVFRFKKGGFGRLDLSWACGQDIANRGILGNKGSLMVDMWCKSVEVGPLYGKRRSIPTQSPVHPKTNENLAFLWQAREVLQRFAANKPHAVGIREGTAAVQLAIALRKSARTNRVVKLSEVK